MIFKQIINKNGKIKKEDFYELEGTSITQVIL